MKEVEFTSPNGKGTAKFPGFSLCVEKNDGHRYRREYAFISNIVRFAGERSCEAAPAEVVAAQAPLPSAGPAAPEGALQGRPQQGLLQRFRAHLRAITRGWFGG
jgi:hypothetical protein